MRQEYAAELTSSDGYAVRVGHGNALEPATFAGMDIPQRKVDSDGPFGQVLKVRALATADIEGTYA